ncbi:MAG TPA: hypothetical protein VL947_10475 [Cytophagales bacterium]|nr:hypothetical protein [Cytophagales bacterium]
MVQILIGSFLLSLIHALIPNHWLPIVLMGRTEHWATRESVGIAALSGLIHTTSTILLGGVIGFIGYKLSEEYEDITHILASLLLVVMGLVYLFLGRKHQHHGGQPKTQSGKRSKAAIVLTFALSMLLSPCLEIETYYFKAGTMGTSAIMAISIVYLMVTVSSMSLLVYAGCKSMERFKFHFLEHYEKRIVGILLIILGVASYFIH